ncbi:MAG: YbaK/EbsC family protein [Peptococcaceae bacterium]|nr:YbaK/EbsC family protein [Peptococcaceae bacterium]
MDRLSKGAQKVQSVLNQFGLELTVIEFPESTRTSREAAEAIGCEVGQIAKSLIFKGKDSHMPVLVIASGKNRVNEKMIQKYVGEKIEKADAAFVLEQTGYAIGGVPPVGHKHHLEPLIDEDLMEYAEIWSAAGTPHAVFKLTPGDLLSITRGKVVAIK